MRNFWIATVCCWLGLCVITLSADLDKIDRTIGKLPAFKAETQGYCLLVFGRDAQKHVWLVRDGDVLYVDRNGNGDLTEPQERVAADAKTGHPDAGEFQFLLGDIADGESRHVDLRAAWFRIDHLRESDSNVRQALERDPNFRGCAISVDMQILGQRGVGIDERVPHLTSVKDHRGLLQFATRPADAPIIHFGGPLEITVADRVGQWRIGRSHELVLVVGTPGIGPGTTACVAYEKFISPVLVPQLQVSFPAASPGEPAVIKSYELARRCCQINLYGDVAVPDNIGTGNATAEISLPDWPGLTIAPTRHEIAIGPPKPGPKLEPVSPRLFSKLTSDHPTTSFGSIRFSPDGKRLIAGEYPEGMIHVWDLASGKRLATMDAGNGPRGSMDYLALAPDWKTVFAWHEPRGKFERLQHRDGKVIHRVEYGSFVRSWNVESGTLLQTLQHTPPHGIRAMFLAPDGKYFLTLDEIPGEFETSRPRGLSLWDTATGEYRQVAKGNAYPGAFSADSRLVAVRLPKSDDDNLADSIGIFSVPEWEQKCKIRIAGPFVEVDPAAFVAEGRILAGSMRVFEKANDWQNFQAALNLWNVATGEEIVSITAEAKNQAFGYIKASPDGQTIVATTFGRQTGQLERLVIVDVAKKIWKTVDIGPRMVSNPQFHPGGKWVAVTTMPTMPVTQLRAASPDDMPQAHIDLIDVASGEIVETLVAPQGASIASVFSPDGRVLATSGKGEVLLWDFQAPPGEPHTAKPAVDQP